ncbi:MAG: glycoside hydrolase family 36 protein [Promethearchaeota archaeon]
MIELFETVEFIAIQGNTLKIRFLKSTNEIEISSLITNFNINGITPAINLIDDNKIITLIPKVPDESVFSDTIISDEIGTGKQVLFDLIFTDAFSIRKVEIKAQLSITLYENHDFCILQLIISKNSAENLSYALHSLAPLRIMNGSIKLNENSETYPENVTFFEHGFQSWSFTKTRMFEEAFQSIEVDVIASIHQNKDNLIHGRFMSEYLTAISDIESKGSLILGFCTLANSFSRIVMDQFRGPSQISWLSAYSQYDGIPMNKLRKKPIKSEELLISFKSQGQGYLGLVEYAEVTSKRMNVQIHQPKVGWCSWYYYYTDISNVELLSNANYFEKSPNIPIDMLQLDDGYFTAIGDYTSFNDKFLDGLSDFVDLTHQQNKAAGIWIAPFFAAENSELFLKHPEWFLHSQEDQELLPVCYNWNQTEYALDLTRPEVQIHIENLINTIVNKWQFDFIKIDFIYAASVFRSQYYKKGLTRAQVYRESVNLIRKIMGKGKYLLGCGAPLGPSIGCVDAMRVSEDTKELWDTGDDPIYGNPCLKYALIGSINRSFMHNKFWVNDPDCLIVRKKNSELTDEEIKLQCTIFGLTGGQLLLSDDMTKIEKERLNLALKLMPPYSATALPINTLYEPLPTLYLLETESVLGKRALLAIINWNDEPVKRNYILKDIFMNSNISDHYLIFDWWEERLIGCFSYKESLPPLDIPPHGCRYLGIIPFEDLHLPLVISSTLHISQGCEEVKRIETNSNCLKITLEQRGYHRGDLFILFPENFKLKSVQYPFSKQSVTWGIMYQLQIEMIDYQEIKLEFKRI